MDKIACVVCGTEFVPKDGRVKCCSPKCSEKRGRLRKAERKREARLKAGIEDGRRISVLRQVGTCMVCGRAIEGYRMTRRYCDSVVCRRVVATISRLHLSKEEAIRKCAELDNAAKERKARKKRLEEEREEELSTSRKCIYFGKAVPASPVKSKMSRICKEDGMANVCEFKGRCPLGRVF